MMKSLDQKLAEIKANTDSRAFIIADAKDADMAFGVRATGGRHYLSGRGERPAQFSPEIWQRGEFGYRNLPEFLDIIREVIRQEKVDILLMSAYVNELLSIKEGLFDQSSITPAARANDATDVWAIRHGCYTAEPAQPFRSASIDHIQCGQLECDRSTDQFPGANLGLYSVTFVNDLEQDKATLNAFKSFREEAEAKRFRYFLEVFNPNVPSGVAPEKMGEFINDHILRSLAGVTESGRPVFLKIPYHGPRAMEELVQYDPNMTVGVLGGSAGTTYDAFKLIHDAQKYGARVALYGRKINQAEHQIAFIEMLRLITEGVIGPAEAVHAYHGVLQAKGIKAHRSLDRDMQLTEQAMSYDETQKSKSTVVVKSSIKTGSKDSADASQKSKETSALGSNKTFDWPVKADGKPDFAAMESAERRAYDRVRLKRTFG
ncbi:hypothetical protein OAH23_04690 [Verrucomicrobia bacterium]|nr:hypothetical protein [Verrucomicrobiota bacterium]MDB4717911.1 hypothetical protein [Verrucomicrobiota bacterium]